MQIAKAMAEYNCLKKKGSKVVSSFGRKGYYNLAILRN